MILFTNVQQQQKNYIYIYKSTVGKGKQQGETEFPYKNCCPKIKDKTIKNRISNM